MNFVSFKLLFYLKLTVL